MTGAIKYEVHLKDETILEKFNEETVAKNFWWAQWNETYQYLAYAHDRIIAQSSFEEVSISKQKSRPYFAILQFHQKFPRESVVGFHEFMVYHIIYVCFSNRQSGYLKFCHYIAFPAQYSSRR